MVSEDVGGGVGIDKGDAEEVEVEAGGVDSGVIQVKGIVGCCKV